MKRWIPVLVILSVLYIAAAHFSGGVFPTPGKVGGDRGWLRKTTNNFLEDIQFKDFTKAASYHAPGRIDEVDIPYLLERLFLQKPEALDIMAYEIVFAEVDSTKLRGRVKARIKYKDLIRAKIKEQELLLFYHRQSLNQPWYMELETSLRKLDIEKDKNH